MSCAFLKRYWALSQIHTQTEPLVAGQLSCDTRLKQFHRSKSARYVSPPWRQGSGNVLWHCFTFYASDLVESRLHCTVWGRRVLLLVAVRWSWPAPEQYVLQHSNQCLRQGLCKTRKKYWGTHGKCPSNFCRMLWYVMISYDMLWYYNTVTVTVCCSWKILGTEWSWQEGQWQRALYLWNSQLLAVGCRRLDVHVLREQSSTYTLW